MRIPAFAAIIALPALLAACDTFEAQQSLDTGGLLSEARPSGSEASYSPFNWSPQQYAGLTAGRIIYPGQDGADPVVVEFLSGKEAEGADIAFTTPEGNVITYSAKGLRGFEGQLGRSQVERDLADRLAGMWETLGPEIRNGLVDAVCVAVTGGACALVPGS